MLLYSNNKRIVVFIDYDSIKGIINNTMLNTGFIERTNCRLINASVYLSVYLLEIHHILKRLNLVPNALLQLRTKRDNIVCINNEAESILDVL